MKRVILALVILSGLGFYFWVELYGDAWLVAFNDERQQTTDQQLATGRALGETLNQQGCFDEALLRVDNCHAFNCTVDVGNLLRGCWETSQPAPKFCESVPAYQDKMTEDDKTWARHGCWDLNSKSQGCRLLMRQKQQLCESVE